MPLHMSRVAVGVGSLEELEALTRRRIGQFGVTDAVPLLTGLAPKRADEIVAGGSLYWIIKGMVLARQRVLGIDVIDGAPHGKRCLIRLAPEIVRTEPQPRRAHQGWRYLNPADAPADLTSSPTGSDTLPPDVAAELKALGLL